ncbi:MAG: hypothetical protein EXR38_05880 [Methylotenera sp.]|nr:hypothetical protein [Methylotenera sp.]MSQ00007.1 hypothetical protein [Methylotenera sp.]
MNIHLLKIFTVLALLSTLNVGAEPDSAAPALAKMFMYIQPIEYSNPIYLWQPYTSYWVAQGPLLEAQTLPKFSQVYGDVSLCESNQSGQTLVWLKPRILYNPQVQIFYGKVTANVYSGMGHFVARYVGESSLHAYLDFKADDSVARTYALALDSLLKKMQADTALQAMVTNANPMSTETTPCSMVTLLPVPKIRVMFFRQQSC